MCNVNDFNGVKFWLEYQVFTFDVKNKFQKKISFFCKKFRNAGFAMQYRKWEINIMLRNVYYVILKYMDNILR